MTPRLYIYEWQELSVEIFAVYRYIIRLLLRRKKLSFNSKQIKLSSFTLGLKLELGWELGWEWDFLSFYQNYITNYF